MPYLPDTNSWIYYLKGSRPNLTRRIDATPATEIVTCSIIWAELLHGALKYSLPDRRLKVVDSVLSLFKSFPFDDDAAQQYALIRDQLERRGETIGPHDLMIAAIAISQGFTVVTSDRHLSRVQGLRVEDWTAS